MLLLLVLEATKKHNSAIIVINGLKLHSFKSAFANWFYIWYNNMSHVISKSINVKATAISISIEDKVNGIFFACIVMAKIWKLCEPFARRTFA